MINMDWVLLEEVCGIHAVSGREDRMVAYARDLIEPLVDSMYVDNLGNVVGVIKGSQVSGF